MAVEGVNNSNNNAGLYALGAGLVGGGTAATIAHATKSILKDGNYSDEFISSITKSDDCQAMIDLFKIDPKSPTYFDDCTNFLVKHAKAIGLDPKEVQDTTSLAKMFGASRIQDVEEKIKGIIEDAKVKFAMENGDIITSGKDSNIAEVLKKHLPDDLDEIYDRTAKEFKQNIKDNDLIEVFKKSQRNIKLKAAGIYGGITALVLGLGTYLLAGKKKPENINTQA